MSYDLVARLRDCAHHARRLIPPRADTIDEAAAEIERQREVERLLHESFQQSTAKIEQQEAEIDRLREDAERYLWIRDPDQSGAGSDWTSYSMEKLDEYIDAARGKT